MDLTRLRRPHASPRRIPGGRPVALPPLLDRASERWWRLAPRARAGLLVALAVLVLALAGRGATRSPWGAPTAVLVATSALGPGDPVGSGAVVGATWPTELVPEDALTATEQLPADARVRGAVPTGAVLTRGHLADGIAGLVTAGEAAVPVPRGGHPPLQSGQVVDAITATPRGTGSRVATEARILALDAEWVWLAVPADRVTALAGAGASGQLVLAVRPVA